MAQSNGHDELDISLDNYQFPTGKLKRCLNDSSKTPLVLVSFGSFSPITYLHLRMFEMAKDYAKHNTNYEVIGGYLSPVSSQYKKQGLAKAKDRIIMCKLAVENSPWIDVDPWEALHDTYQRTAVVMDHFEHEINTKHRIETYTGERVKAKVMMLAGADLIQTMGTPGVWSEEESRFTATFVGSRTNSNQDIEHLLGKYGAFIIERAGTEVGDAVSTLQQWQDNIHIIPQLIPNDVSSTKIRLFRRRDMSILYLLPDAVAEYIETHNLYREEPDKSKSVNKD